MAKEQRSLCQDDVVETLDEGDVVRLHDDSGDFIVYTAGDGLSVIKRAPVFDWEYDRLVGLDSDEPAAGYTRLIWPEDIAGIQYRTPLEPQVGDRVLTRWRDGNRSGVHTGFVDEVKGRTYQVHLVAGGDVLTSHDPASGQENWRWGTWNPGHKQQWWRLVPSPVVGDGVGLVCAPKRAPIFAVNLNQKGENEGPEGLRWDTSSEPTLTSDVPTPLFYRNRFFVLSDLRKSLSSVDPKTGKPSWSIELPGKYKWRGSPTAGDGKI